MLPSFMHRRRKSRDLSFLTREQFAKPGGISSEHTDFSESTEEIAPMTEDEKKARLEELRERVKAKRAASAVQDKEEAKRNEVRPAHLSLHTISWSPLLIFTMSI